MKLSLENKIYVICFTYCTSILFTYGWIGLEYLLEGEIITRDVDNIIMLLVTGIIYFMWYFFFKFHELKLRSIKTL